MFRKLELPIVIISSIRTGSTALIFELEKFFLEKGITPVVLSEPKVVRNKSDSLLPFFQAINTNNFIIKIHAFDLRYYPSYFLKKIANNEFNLIRLRRKSIVDQYISLYISLYTQIWYNNDDTNEQLEYTNIKISQDLLEKTIENANKWNQAVDECPFKFVLDLYYEDLQFLRTRTVKRVSLQAEEELRSHIIKMIT